MIRRYTTYILSSLMALATAACSGNDIAGDVPGNGNTAHTGETVLFTVGATENAEGRTRAEDNASANDAKTYYMPDGSRFVCRMYYIAKDGTDEIDITGTDQTTFLKVSGNVGNSLYWNRMYTDAQQTDEYGNDYYAPCFYWQNRKKHVFLAWTDLNHAKTMAYGETPGSLKFEPADIMYGTSAGHAASEENGAEELPANVFSLKRTESMSSIADQPDVVRAIKEQEPIGATQAANRVNLYFKHQFALVEVNIKNSADNSVMISSDDILSAELLGVSEEAYLFTTVDKDGKVEPTTYKDVNVTDYTDEQLAENPYGTAFSLFDMYDADKDNNGYATGYLKSFNGITFGQLQAIRIRWKENTTGIIHTVVYRVTKTDLQNMESGKRYVWNMELRRGTLAVIRAEIADWEIDPTQYAADGTIKDKF